MLRLKRDEIEANLSTFSVGSESFEAKYLHFFQRYGKLAFRRLRAGFWTAAKTSVSRPADFKSGAAKSI
jgi:hypothetical protein